MLPTGKLNIKKVRTFNLPDAPLGIACSPVDDSIAVCGLHKDKVYIYTGEGQEVSTISPGCAVRDVAATQDSLYITENETENGRVFVYNKNNGKRTNTITVGYKGHAGIALTDMHMFVTSREENLVYRLNMQGGDKTVFIKGRDLGLSKPWNIATNGHRVAVSFFDSHKVAVFDMKGACQFVYGGFGHGPGQLQYPWGVTFDSLGRLLICDCRNHRIIIVSPQGDHVRDFRLDDDGLKFPVGLAVTLSDQMVVTCQNPNTLAIYQMVP